MAWLAGFWGLFSGSALLLGAALGYFVRFPQSIIAAIMAYGAGILLSALAFELVEQAYDEGGFTATAIGFLGGAILYTLANGLLARQGASDRKRSAQQPSETTLAGSGMAIAVGALLDGIPESMVIGISLLGGQTVSWVTVIAVFLSNVPEGLSSAAGMKQAGRSVQYVFTVWGAITLLSGMAAICGYVGFRSVELTGVAAMNTIAAGAMLAMITNTMIPEAVAVTHGWTGFITVCGFLSAFLISRMT